MIIGFTVGTWDLFHYGHKLMLKKCNEKCDFLCVGVMTDYWVRVQKGNNRPIHALSERIERVKLSKLANKVISIDVMDMSPYLQIADIWFLGEDQNKMRPENYHNKIIIPRTKGISTTMLLSNDDS